MKVASAVVRLMMSFACVHGIALPTEIQDDHEVVSTSPFHDCLTSGKSFNDCQAILRMQTGQEDLKRSVSSTSTSPFHDCMEQEGASWTQCSASTGLISRTVVSDPGESRAIEKGTDVPGVFRRGLPSVFEGIVQSLNKTFVGGAETCYSVNDLGGTGWLTNTKVRSLKTEACTFAVQQAAKAGGVGTYKTTTSGFYQANAGPVVSPRVQFYLSVALMGAELSGLDITDVQAFAIDLCLKGVDHLVADKGCTAQRKVGAIVSHTSVNGGEFDWALAPDQNEATAMTQDATLATPNLNGGLGCQNCMMTMIMEAANKVDKDGITATPADS